MFKTYLKYFFSYIISAKSRQRLLILSVVGLFLSSFALIVLQSTMGGLQNKLMNRSKAIVGDGIIYLKQDDVLLENVDALKEKLDQKKVKYTLEYEIELLLKFQTFLTPVLVHGVDLNSYLPPELRFEFERTSLNQKIDSVMPIDMAFKIGVAPPEVVSIVSPTHVDEMLGDIPRSQSFNVEGTFSTNVPEIDQFHMWVRLPLIQNLIQSHNINRIRLYDVKNIEKLRSDIAPFGDLRTWGQENKTLVWALNLESTIMVFLFAAMSLLVSLCITSGLLIFFSKIKNDLSSFWILGTSFNKIDKATRIFLFTMSSASILVGIGCGLLFLLTFNYFGPEIMPDVFVDRKIPILVTARGILLSFFIPFLISSVFIMFSLNQFKKEHNLLDHVRSVS